jgi:DNA end-binding protein Ku
VFRPHLLHRARGKEYPKVYELLRAALAEGNKAGIATFVMRNKEYLTALRAEDKVLVLQTLHFDALSGDWEPKRYYDTYQEKCESWSRPRRRARRSRRPRPRRRRPTSST